MKLGELSEVTCPITESQVREIATLLTLIIVPTVAYDEDPLIMANGVIKKNKEIALIIMGKLPKLPWENNG